MTALVSSVWDNRTSETARSSNSQRSLTHPLGLSEEGLAMHATRTVCRPYEDTPEKFQERAIRLYVEILERDSVLPWTWATNLCGTPQCLRWEHLVVTSPTKIAYPPMICVYCGRPGGAKDHLLPVGYTGKAQRRFVATVPACTQCNSAIGSLPDYRIGARRKVSHEYLRKRYRKWLQPVADYHEFEGNLRKFVLAAHKNKALVKALLAWPDDPDYDLRAFQKSGIEDPYGMGLI